MKQYCNSNADQILKEVTADSWSVWSMPATHEFTTENCTHYLYFLLLSNLYHEITCLCMLHMCVHLGALSVFGAGNLEYGIHVWNYCLVKSWWLFLVLMGCQGFDYDAKRSFWISSLRVSGGKMQYSPSERSSFWRSYWFCKPISTMRKR
jgi:hypothetical protein